MTSSAMNTNRTTFAEMPAEAKNAISHRRKAFLALRDALGPSREDVGVTEDRLEGGPHADPVKKAVPGILLAAGRSARYAVAGPAP